MDAAKVSFVRKANGAEIEVATQRVDRHWGHMLKCRALITGSTLVLLHPNNDLEYLQLIGRGAEEGPEVKCGRKLLFELILQGKLTGEEYLAFFTFCAHALDAEI